MPFEMDSTISIHAPPARGATIPGITYTRQNLISIHAPREGGDFVRGWLCQPRPYFNPCPPRGGRQQRCTVLPADL